MGAHDDRGIDSDAADVELVWVPGAFEIPLAAREMAAALATPEVRERLAGIGMQATPLNATEFTAYLRRHREEFRQVIEANNLRADG